MSRTMLTGREVRFLAVQAVFIINFKSKRLEGCRRLNMDEENSGWIGAAAMNHWHGWGWQMVSLGNKAYAMGGYRDYCNEPSCGVDIAIEYMERYDEDTNAWTNVASYPLYIYNHCMVADEETGRIWVMGGQYRTGTHRNESHDWSELRYYEVALWFTFQSINPSL